MIYYHVSLGKDELVKRFRPRIPNNGSGSEDRTIPRICFAPTVEQCLSAIPNVELDFEEQWEQNGEIWMTVYTLYLDDVVCDMVYNDEVQRYVPDSFVTGEVWCLDEVVLEGSHVLVEYYEMDYVYVCSENFRPRIAQEVCEYVGQGRLPEYALEVLDSTTVHDFMNYRLVDDFEESGLIPSDFPSALDSGILYTFTLG